MLKDRGKGFVDSISNFHKNLKEADSEALYTLPSQWWAGLWMRQIPQQICTYLTS